MSPVRARLGRLAPAASGAALAVLAAAMLAACGSAAHPPVAVEPARSCPQTVVADMLGVVRRVYHEGVDSERTLVARRTIAAAVPLREAVRRDDPAAARAAARALVAAGHLTNLRVSDARGRVLADVGGPAVAPLQGVLPDAAGHPLGTYVTSVWSDEGLLAESDSLAEGRLALRAGDRSVGGSLALPPGPLPAQGTLVLGGVRYQYASFGAEAYPSGALRVYLLRTVASTLPLCGADATATTVNTLARVARRIYDGEAGRRTLPQVRRVQRDRALLAAVAARDPLAARAAVAALLNQHIVRLRVLAGASLLADVGGPYVLAPVSAPLRLGGRTIGSLVLSIQDDEGYLRLTRRLAGLRVLMYEQPPGSAAQLVKNSLGPQPGSVPESGPYSYHGASYRVYTFHVAAFPSWPLRIAVLIPIPYT